MAQSAPRDIDLSTLWSDGTGVTPQGPGYTQILRGSDRHTAWLDGFTSNFNKEAQFVTQHGSINLIGDLPQGYTLWVQTTGQKPVVLLFGHPRGKSCRAASNFSNHVNELLNADHAKEIGIWNQVRAENQRRATAAVARYNEWAINQRIQFGLNHPLRDNSDYVAAWGLEGFDPVDEKVAVQKERRNNPTIAFPCSCVFR
ncbi:hypothetical protein QM012_008637 [Aureobasidium pullulans]|uniref:Uncharacterized protein n=1 Tax=Aureobasidium pullulans TaxID=5580 RepID=A0ABR0TLK3_AURPU